MLFYYGEYYWTNIDSEKLKFWPMVNVLGDWSVQVFFGWYCDYYYSTFAGQKTSIFDSMKIVGQVKGIFSFHPIHLIAYGRCYHQ